MALRNGVIDVEDARVDIFDVCREFFAKPPKQTKCFADVSRSNPFLNVRVHKILHWH